jgi:hypothetical protein
VLDTDRLMGDMPDMIYIDDAVGKGGVRLSLDGILNVVSWSPVCLRTAHYSSLVT